MKSPEPLKNFCLMDNISSSVYIQNWTTLIMSEPVNLPSREAYDLNSLHLGIQYSHYIHYKGLEPELHYLPYYRRWPVVANMAPRPS